MKYFIDLVFFANLTNFEKNKSISIFGKSIHKMKTPVFFTFLLTAVCSFTSQASNIHTKTFSMEDVTPTSSGWAYWFIPRGGIADTLDIKMSCVTKKTGTHGGHRHNHGELFIVIEGEAIANLNGEDHAMHPGDGIFCPGQSEHSIRRASLNQAIRYLMVNTSVAGGLKEPLPFWKESYTAKDCYVASGKNTFWYLKPEQTLNGLNVKSVLLKRNKVHKSANDGRQLVYLILEGKASVCVGGESVELSAMSMCYVPAGSSSSIAAVDGSLRYLSIRTH